MKYKQYYIYILASKRSGTLYIGATSNLIKRVWQHKNKLINGFTKKYNIDKLVYFEITDDIRSAILREKRIKKWNRQWKIELIKKNNLEWKDLYESFFSDVESRLRGNDPSTSSGYTEGNAVTFR